MENHKEFYLKGNRPATISRLSIAGYVVRFTRFNEFSFKSIIEARKFLKALGFEEIDPGSLDSNTRVGREAIRAGV